MENDTDKDALLEADREIGQLKETIKALREELSTLVIEHTEKLEAETADFKNENEELKLTIKVLRQELEKAAK